MHTRFFFSVQGIERVDCYNRNLYDMKKLLIVANATYMSTLIHLYINPHEDVLGMKYRVGTIGVFRCMIAPLVEKSTLVFGDGGDAEDRRPAPLPRRDGQEKKQSNAGLVDDDEQDLDLTF
jgi:hypothetical protein